MPLVETPAFVPGFLDDVFISYAHRDEGSERWVSTFCRLLKEKLEYELMSDVRVWSDAQLSAGDVLDATLKRRIQRSAVLVAIVSHWYFEREWCQREVSYFLSGAEASGLMVGTTSRFIPVIKREADNWPDPLRKLDPLAVYFCRDDHTFPATVESDSPFFSAVEGLARDLKRLLQAMKEQSERRSETQTVMVLAPMSGLRSKEYEHLRNWLKGKQCVVRPTEELPRTREGIVQMLQDELANSRLAIHLLGSAYDMIPTHEQQLSVEALAFATVRSSGKRQLIWAGKEAREDESQKGLLEHIQSLRDAQTELVSAEFSEFLEGLPEELQKSAASPQIRDQGIYLICEKSDLSQPEYAELRSHLISQGYPLTLSSFQGDPIDLRELEEEQILSHDITLIYYGTAPDVWAERKRSNTRKVLLKKAPPERPRRALYLGPPDVDGLKVGKYGPFLGHEMPEMGNMSIYVLGGSGSFVPASLKPLWWER